MRYVGFDEPGGIDVLKMKEGAIPQPQADEVLLRVHAAALNRADTLQRTGFYVPPPDQSQIMGVEVSGKIVALGEEVTDLQIGDRVMGLVNGGGYAEYCTMHRDQAVVMPDSLAFSDGAALPEACYTIHETMIQRGQLQAGQTVLVHAGASGMGSMALQMARYLGARALFTTSTEEKHQKCLQLGGDVGILYKDEDFVARVMEETQGRGVDLVIDFVGASYFDRNVEVLAPDGRLILVGILGGYLGEVDLLPLIMKRIHVIGFSMRGQSQAAKSQIVARFQQHWIEPIAQGALKAVVHSTHPLERVADAHREIEANRNIGKILLTCA